MEQQIQIPNYFQIFLNRIEDLEAQVQELRQHQHLGGGSRKVEDQLFTIEEAAEFLSVSRTTIYLLKAANKIPFMQKGKRLYFTRENLMKWLEEGSQTPNSLQCTNQEIVQRYLKPRRKKLGN